MTWKEIEQEGREADKRKADVLRSRCIRIQINKEIVMDSEEEKKDRRTISQMNRETGKQKSRNKGRLTKRQ